MSDMRWIVQYADGRIVREFDFVGGFVRGHWVETPWTNLDLSNVISCGIEGNGLVLGFRTDDGIFGVNGKPLELIMADEKGNFPLTGRRDVQYRPFQYKDAYVDIRGILHGGVKEISSSRVTAYNVGWEWEKWFEGYGLVYCKVVLSASPGSRTVRGVLEVKFENGFLGKTGVFVDGKLAAEVSTILRPETVNRLGFQVEG